VFDLILSPINLEAGQDRKELPGLYAAVPRKAARLRAGDQLILLLNQAGNAPMPASMLQEVFTRLAETYYTSTGSVTAGMKAVAERLNDFLIGRNTRQSRQQGGQTVGLLSMAVVRGSTVSIAHAGPQHTYVIVGGKVEHFTDASQISRGLGLAKLVSLRFYQAVLEGEAGLVLSGSAPSRWTDAVLAAALRLDATAAHRQLASGSADLQAGLVRLKPGKGQVHWDMPSAALRASEIATAIEQAPENPRPRPQPAAVTRPPVEPAQPVQAEAASAEAGQTETEDEAVVEQALEPSLDAPREMEPELESIPAADSSAVEQPLGVYLSAPSDQDRAPWEEAAQGMPEPAPEQPVVQTAAAEQPVQPRQGLHQPAGRVARQRLSQEHAQGQAAQQTPPEPVSEPAPARPPRRRSAAGLGAARFLSGLIAGLRKAGGRGADGLNKLAARALPDQPPEGLRLSASTMLFIALAVPVLVVAVAATIYAQRGRGELQLANIQAARKYVDQATQREDLALRRQDWRQAVALLDKADSYGETEASNDLRDVIQRGMDDLDSVHRIIFRPALNSTLGEGVKISRMVAWINDVYLLDSTQGRILRIYRSGQAYALDPSFACGAVDYGTIQVGKLLDITLLPPDNVAKATVMGIDEHGNVLMCGLNEKPAAYVLPVPDNNWGNITRAVFFRDVLYVLDALSNQVFRFTFSDGNIDEGAGIYFDVQTPKLDDVIDIAVDQEYLYLLHSNGMMTTCSDTGDKTVCDDPAPYGDIRQEYESSPLKFEGTSFVLMQASQPPDPSLYILDSSQNSIYHFSLRKLNLQRQYRPEARGDYPPQDRKASAFLITPNRRLIMVVDNQAYLGVMP